MDVSLNGERGFFVLAICWIGAVSTAAVRTFTNQTELKYIKESVDRIERKLDRVPKEASDGDKHS